MDIHFIYFHFFVFNLSVSSTRKLLKCFTDNNRNNGALINRIIEWHWCCSLILWLVTIVTCIEEFIWFIWKTWNCLSFSKSWMPQYFLFQLLLICVVKLYFFIHISFFWTSTALRKFVYFLNVIMIIEKWSHRIALGRRSFHTCWQCIIIIVHHWISQTLTLNFSHTFLIISFILFIYYHLLH